MRCSSCTDLKQVYVDIAYCWQRVKRKRADLQAISFNRLFLILHCLPVLWLQQLSSVDQIRFLLYFPVTPWTTVAAPDTNMFGCADAYLRGVPRYGSLPVSSRKGFCLLKFLLPPHVSVELQPRFAMLESYPAFLALTRIRILVVNPFNWSG